MINSCWQMTIENRMEWQRDVNQWLDALNIGDKYYVLGYG